jgi:histidinol phosphatase-like enzyme
VIVELDGVVWRGRPVTPDAIELVAGASERLAAWNRAGWTVVATAWMPDAADAGAMIAAVRARVPALGAVARCTHPAGPPVCWCRKPLPGMGLVLARDHDLDLARSIHVGTGPADRTFATRLGMAYVDQLDAVPPEPTARATHQP